MPSADYEDIFDIHRGNYRKKEKLELLDDLQGQFQDEQVSDILMKQNGASWLAFRNSPLVSGP